MKKKLFSLLIALTLVLGLMAVTPMITHASSAEPPAHSHCICGGKAFGVGDHTCSPDAIDWQPHSSANNLPGSGSYYLTTDVRLNSDFPIQNLDLCLNGHTITFLGYQTLSSAKFLSLHQNSTLNLCDCSAAGTGKIDGTGQDSSGIETHYYSNTAINFYSGTLTGFSRGITASNQCSLTMYGGSISGNQSTRETYYMNGAGIYVGNDSSFTMYGGSITGNAAHTSGGGVYNLGTTKLYGGSITGNTADRSGSGIYCGRESTLLIEGNVTVLQNTGWNFTHNIFLDAFNNTQATVTKLSLTGGAVGFSVGALHDGTICQSFTANDAATLFSDSASMLLVQSQNNLLLVSDTVTVGNVTLSPGEYTVDGENKQSGTLPTSGYAAYQNGVLTLNGFSYSGNNADNSVIHSKHALTVTLVGENTLTSDDGANGSTAFRTVLIENGDLTVTGSGKLNLHAIDAGLVGSEIYAIYVPNGGLSLQNTALNLDTSSYTMSNGIRVGGACTLQNADLTVITKRIGISCASFTAADSFVTVHTEKMNAIRCAGAITLYQGKYSLISDGSALDAPTVTLPDALYCYRTDPSFEYSNASSPDLYQGSSCFELFTLTLILPTASDVTEGELLSTSNLSGGSVTGFGGMDIPGSFSWLFPDTVMTGTGNYSAEFSPSDPMYELIPVFLPVTVHPLPPTPPTPPAPPPVQPKLRLENFATTTGAFEDVAYYARAAKAGDLLILKVSTSEMGDKYGLDYRKLTVKYETVGAQQLGESYDYHGDPIYKDGIATEFMLTEGFQKIVAQVYYAGMYVGEFAPFYTQIS